MNQDNSQAEMFITNRGSLKWLGSFEELKKFCDKDRLKMACVQRWM